MSLFRCAAKEDKAPGAGGRRRFQDGLAIVLTNARRARKRIPCLEKGNMGTGLSTGMRSIEEPVLREKARGTGRAGEATDAFSNGINVLLITGAQDLPFIPGNM